MIVSVQEALEYLKKDLPERELRRKIDALENLILLLPFYVAL